ncbi:YajQ family cyclic di-GMP-binding protein [bacterium]|nr:YajQ family cyclic di-GMP-binding protein [bacterium]
MATDHSFDIASKVDPQEVTNAVNQALKEITQRYDLKDAGCEIEFKPSDHLIQIAAADDFKVTAVGDVLKQKIVKREISLKALSFGEIKSALGGTAKQEIKIQDGIPIEKAKEIVKDIKDAKLKVQSQIQGDQVRVSSKSIDELQAVIKLVRSKDYGIDVGVNNFR